MKINKKKELARQILSFPYTLYNYLYHTLISVKRYSHIKTYYPEKKHKCFLRNGAYVLGDFFIGNKFIEFYKLYGFDVKGSKKKDFVSEKQFWKISSRLNGLASFERTACYAGSQLYLLRDKIEFYHFMKRHGLPVPEIYFIVNDGKYYDTNLNLLTEEMVAQFRDYFIKDANGQCASFVKKINDVNDLKQYTATLSNGLYLAQERVCQCEELNNLNDKAINTLRIVTVYNDGQPVVFSQILRVGVEASNNVDNWAAGGLAVGLNDDGTLKKYGFYKKSTKKVCGKTEIHPDSQILFDNYRISYFREACELACLAHKYFYGVHSIGWDIAVTKNGPVFIEGNDNWEISLMQCANGGLKTKFKQYFLD